jgi:hypothetical protein
LPPHSYIPFPSAKQWWKIVLFSLYTALVHWTFPKSERCLLLFVCRCISCQNRFLTQGILFCVLALSFWS